MVIHKKTTLLALAILALFSLALSASADTSNGALVEKDRAVISAGDDELDLGDIDNLDEDLKDLAESFDDLDKNLSDAEKKLDDGADKSNDDDVSDRSKGEEHRSDIADIMDELDKLARDAGAMGDDIRDIVGEQRDLEDRATKAIDEVEKRDSLRTFLFGADYKNLGELRSTIETTQNHIERLTKAAERTGDTTVRADLEAQIQALEDTASSTEAFVRDNEEKFSLFGWLVKMFD